MKRANKVEASWGIERTSSAITSGSPSMAASARKIVRVLAVLLLLHETPARAQDVGEAFERLVSAKSLRCEIGSGSSVHWESGKPKVNGASFNVALHFDSIDTKKGTGRLIGNQGSADVWVLLTASGITFIEPTPGGNFMFTTVFAEHAPKSRDFMAVHSRHLAAAGLPMPGQYHGVCKVWD